MARSIANVQIATDSFAGLVDKTNQLLNALSVEILTASNTAAGANVSGNSSVIGIFSANVVATPSIRGGQSGNTAAVSSLALGFANSTISSNVSVVGYNTSITSNSLNITSNVNVFATNVSVNATFMTVSGNTVLRTNSSVNAVSVIGNNSQVDTTVIGNSFNVSSETFNTISITTITGNTSLKGNSSVTSVSVTGNTETTEVSLQANSILLQGEITANGDQHYVDGNVRFTTNTLVIDSINERVGIFTDNPEYPLHVVSTNTTISIASFSNPLLNTEVELKGEVGDLNGNNGIVQSGNGNHLVLTSDYGDGGYIFIAANGNVGINNSSPTSSLKVGGAAVFDGTLTANGDLVITGDVYANIIFMGGTATICPISPPAVNSTSNSYLTFTSTTPQILDLIAVTDYQAVKYSIQIQNPNTVNDVMFTEVSMAYGYGNAHSTQYGTIFTNTQFANVSVASNSTHYWIQGAPTSAYLSAMGGSVNLEIRGVRQKCK